MSTDYTLYRSDFIHIEKVRESKFSASHDIEAGNIDFTIEASTFAFDKAGDWHAVTERFHFILSNAQAIDMWKALGRVVPNDEPRVLNVPREVVEA